jgi:hypothetical protein
MPASTVARACEGHHGEGYWIVRSLPGVSLLCPTFGRPPTLKHLIEECILSFLLQDYPGPKELVILIYCTILELLFMAA